MGCRCNKNKVFRTKISQEKHQRELEAKRSEGSEDAHNQILSKADRRRIIEVRRWRRKGRETRRRINASKTSQS